MIQRINKFTALDHTITLINIRFGHTKRFVSAAAKGARYPVSFVAAKGARYPVFRCGQRRSFPRVFRCVSTALSCRR